MILKKGNTKGKTTNEVESRDEIGEARGSSI